MTITIPVTIGTSNAGQALEAALVDSGGALQAGWPVTTGFAMAGSVGIWTGDVPDGWRGAIDVRKQSDHSVLMVCALDPADTTPAIDASALWTYANRTLTAGVIVVAATRQTGRIELVRGMSYLNATANALTFNKSAAFAWPADLFSLPWTVTLYVKPSDRTLDDSPAALPLGGGTGGGTGVAGTVASATAVRFDLSAAQTGALSLGGKQAAYRYSVVASSAGKEWLLEDGVVDLVDDVKTA